MNFLKDAFEKSGLRIDFVANKLEIRDKTLKYWLDLKNIEYTIKFIELLSILKIDINEFLQEYYKTNKYKKAVDAEAIAKIKNILKESNINVYQLPELINEDEK
jgi:hypothetical protein